MKHRVTICTVVNDQYKELALWTDEAKEIGLIGRRITTLDNIQKISLCKNKFILLTASPRFRYSTIPSPDFVPNYDINCVDAYDYEGNHLWNIAEIIGNVGTNICNGHICSTQYLMGDSRDKYIEGHELFVCWDSNEMRYLIDLDEKKVIHKMLTP